MVGKKLLEVFSIWENSNKTLLDLKEEFNLKNTEIEKLREYIRNSKNINIRNKN